MINPIAAKIAFRTTSSTATTPVTKAAVIPNANSDSFISSANFGNSTQENMKSSRTLLEILFGNVKKSKTNNAAKAYNRYEAKLYAKPKNEAELREFIDSYEPMIKW